MNLQYITWNVNPTAFALGSFEIRWYGILFACVFAAGYMILDYILKKEKQSPKMIDSLLMYVVIAVIVGARLGHCFFYEPSYYLAHPIEILYIRDGGLSSHGAAFTILFALWLIARKYQKKYLWILDRVVMVVALGGLFIRTGNLMNSEIFGLPTTLPWGFRFIRSASWYEPPCNALPCHPTQIYEALSYFFIFICLIRYFFKQHSRLKDGIIFGWFLIGVFGMRFLIEFLKANQEPWEDQYLLNMGQILSIPFVILGVAILFIRKRQANKASL